MQDAQAAHCGITFELCGASRRRASERTNSYARGNDMEPREPTIEVYGPVATHDQRCAVLPGESAVLDLDTGRFQPSWAAQAQGWRLVRARNWWQRIALRLLAHNVECSGG